MNNVVSFSEWLLFVLDDRDWSQADLARAAKVSPASISDVVSGRRKVGKDLATAIASGLKLPPEQVFRAAGILPSPKKVDEEIERIVHEVEQLSKQDQAEVLAFIRMLNNLRGKKKK